MAASMLKAFGGEPAVREAALARLRAHRASRTLTSGFMFWNGRQGSVAGCLVGSDDLAEWQSALQLAPWLAFALDAVTDQLDPERAVDVAADILEAIAPGADTVRVGSRVVLGVLAQLPAALAGDAAQEVVALHARCATGDAPANAEWRSARRQATAWTDAAEGDERQAVGACIEAAAWDPASSAAAAGDVLRLWIRVLANDTDRDLGWSPEKDRQVRAALQRMHDTYVKDRPEETRDVFLLLRAHDPALEGELRAYTVGRRRMQQQYQAQAARFLAEALRTPA